MYTYNSLENDMSETEAKVIYTCEWCKDEICEGDDYIELNDCYYHEDCFKDNCVEVCGAYAGVAERDYY